jgi:hypothetical protein
LLEEVSQDSEGRRTFQFHHQGTVCESVQFILLRKDAESFYGQPP